MIQGRGQAKEYKQPLEAEKVRTCFLPLNLQKEQKAADILSLKIFIYFWLCWVLITSQGLSLVAESGGYFLVAVLSFLIVVAFLVVKHWL